MSNYLTRSTFPSRSILPFAFLVLTLAATSILAQSSDATLSGTVVDPQGSVIPGVKVTITNPATGFERILTTNESGSFNAPLLQPGNYTLLVEGQGFKRVQLQNVILNVGDQKALQVQLSVGDVAGTVDVVADPILLRTDGSVGTVVDRQFVGNLPLNGRSFQSLISLTPGIVITRVTPETNRGQFSVNGQRTDTNYFTVDGVSANIGINGDTDPDAQSLAGAQPGLAATGGTNNLLSVDALQEFKVQTNSYAPEFGRSPGAQVQLASRSGTNQFRGSLFEYFRNDALDATDWFANANRLRKPPLRQNDFGGVLGGPILLPRFGDSGRQPWYNGRDRTFFFFSYEGLRLRQPQVTIHSVPSLTTRREAAATLQPYVNAFPLPNGPDLINPVNGQPTGFAQFSASYSDAIDLDATSIRIDHTVNNRLSVFGRYNDAPSANISRGSALRGVSTNILNSGVFNTRTLTLGTTWSLSSSVFNDLRANYSRATGGSTNTIDSFGGAVVPPDTLFFPPFTSREAALAMIGFVYSGNVSQLAIGLGADHFQRQINLVDTLSVVKGPHQFKLGVDYRRLSPIKFPRDYQLNLFFLNSGDVRAGRASLITRAANERVRPVFTNVSLFWQDTWKATGRLTMTYGFRWEVNPPPQEADGKDAFTLTGLDDPATYALAPRGTPLYETTYTNFAPRFGVAYQLSQANGRETVVRGGIGIFYDMGSNQAAGAFLFPFSVAITNLNLPLPLTPAQVARPALPTNFNPPFSSQFSVYTSDFKLPYTLQWNIAAEQSLGADQTISATYVAALGRRLLRRERRSRPNPNFTGLVDIYRNDAASDYHALQLQYNRRLSKGLQALASYTWSHAIDEVSDGVTFTSERGSADFDVRHVFSAAISYNLPAPKMTAPLRWMLRDWSVDAIARSQSAYPVNLVARTNITVDGTSQNIRPDLITGVPLYIHDRTAPGGRRFNPAAFAIPPIGRQGTLGRNVLRGFPLNQVDLALRRQLQISERVQLQLRAEVFNIFNHPNFGTPNESLTSGQFGRPTQMLGRSLGGLNPLYQVGGPRSIQLALKLQF